MPIYESFCDVCQSKNTYYAKVDDRYDTPECCGSKTHKAIFTPPMGVPDIEPYQSPIDGRVIHSRSDRRDDFERHQCRPWEGIEQEKKEAAARSKEIEARQDKKLDEAIHKSIAELNPEKRQILGV